MKTTTRKGQYFSFDAIIASVIFILAISILSAHWFALRAQIDASTDYLAGDSTRVSDLLLGVGEPATWINQPQSALRGGFAVNGSIPEELNATMLLTAQTNIGNAVPGSAQGLLYDRYRALLALGSQFKIIINTTDPNTLYSNFSFGRTPSNATEIAQVRRVIVIQDPVNAKIPNSIQYYDGNLTLIIWSNQTRT